MSLLIHPDFVPGSVWLAGAGPGDPTLLTLATHHALGAADVIVHDALVSAEILALAPPGAGRIAAGKRGGRKQMPQLAINALLIDLASRNLRVLRLKGGDPFVFGRGGEECIALAAAGIPLRVIPGISAGIGGTASALIPITHRGLARSVTFVTGETGLGGAAVDYAALARSADTLVLYMARRKMGVIADALIAGGRSPTEPVAFVLDATTPKEQVVRTTLVEAPLIAASLPPAATLIVIGDVVSLGAMLSSESRRLDDLPPDLPSPFLKIQGSQR